MKKVESNRRITLIGALILVLITWYIMPLVKYYVRDLYALIYGVALCFFCALNSKEASKYFVFSFLSALLLATIVSAFAYNFSFQPLYSLLIHLLLFFCVPPTLFLYIKNHMSLGELDIIVKAITVIILTVFVSSFIVLLSYPEAARALASSSASNELLNRWRRSNVGGFNFTYSMGLFFLLTIDRLKGAKGYFKGTCILMLICMAYFFLMAQYVTLLIILIGVSMIYLIMQNQKNGGVLAVGGFLILLILINLAGIFRFFAGVIESEIISRRLYEVAEFLAGGEMGVSMESRWDVYMEGLQYFIKSPIWGNNVESYGGIDIWHSTVIEYLVKAGLIGITIYFILLKNATKNTFIIKGKMKNKLVAPCMIYFVVLSILNPTQYAHEIAILLWLFIPLILLKEERKGEFMEN